MFKIRKFQPDDTFSVVNIAYNSLPERYNPSVFNIFYETFPKGFIVAEKYHKIVGFIVGVKTSKTMVKIPMLAVSENYRRKGIGTELLTSFLKKLSMQNIKQVELEVRTNNTAAIAFYEKHGFAIIDTIKGFYQNGEDARIMRKVV